MQRLRIGENDDILDLEVIRQEEGHSVQIIVSMGDFQNSHLFHQAGPDPKAFLAGLDPRYLTDRILGLQATTVSFAATRDAFIAALNDMEENKEALPAEIALRRDVLTLECLFIEGRNLRDEAAKTMEMVRFAASNAILPLEGIRNCLRRERSALAQRFQEDYWPAALAAIEDTGLEILSAADAENSLFEIASPD